MAFSSDPFREQMRYMEEVMRRKHYEMEQMAMQNAYASPNWGQQVAEPPAPKKPSKPAHLNPKLLITKGA